VFNGITINELEQDHSRFINYILSYGAIIHGQHYSTTQWDEITVNSVCIYYDTAINVTDEIINKWNDDKQ